MDFKKFYEWYHRDRKLPKRVVNDKNFTYRHVIEVLDKYCKSNDVLDVGSGVGTVDFYLAKKGKKITGIEISQKAYDIAVKSSKILGLEKNVTFIRSDFIKSKINKTYNFIICSEVLEHLPEEKKTLLKIHKLLKRNGHFMLTVPSANSPLEKLGLIEAFDKRSGHLRRYTLESTKKLLLETGFKPIFSAKREGILRYSLFVFRMNFVIKVANRFAFISNLITFFDDIAAKLLGEADIIIVSRKI